MDDIRTPKKKRIGFIRSLFIGISIGCFVGLLFGTVFGLGRTVNPEPFQVSTKIGAGAIKSYPQNQSPVVYLYPAIDEAASEPKFFENTTYEIILGHESKGKYLGKFNADRINQTYLNLTFGNYLNILVTVNDGACYVFPKQMEYFVAEVNNYITPRTKCAKDLNFILWYDWQMMPLKTGSRNEQGFKIDGSGDLNNVIKASSGANRLTMTLNNRNNYAIFACDIDHHFIYNYEVRVFDVFNLLTSRRGNFDPQVFDGFSMPQTEKQVTEKYGLTFNILPGKPFTTNVVCKFYDVVYFVENYRINYAAMTEKFKDVGRENPSFNFTIEYSG